MPQIDFKVECNGQSYQIAVDGWVVALDNDEGSVELPFGLHRLTWLGVGTEGNTIEIVGTRRDTGTQVVADEETIPAGFGKFSGVRDFKINA